MKYNKERTEGIPCGQQSCHYWDRIMAQNCDKENGSGDPGPAFCVDYVPQQIRSPNLYSIGNKVQDEDGNTGYVGIYWNDGDFCTIENDAAHPNPKLITSSSSK